MEVDKIGPSESTCRASGTPAQQQLRIPLELSKALYGGVRGWVSHEAMRCIEEQRMLLVKKDLLVSQTCTGTFTRIYGLPCVHVLRTHIYESQAYRPTYEPLRMDQFHTHWMLQREGKPVQLHLLEPRQRIDPIRVQSTLPRSSTQREPSLFEVVEASQQASQQASQHAPSTCSACHTVGHRMGSKACPMKYLDIV